MSDGDARREWVNENIEDSAYLADGFDEAIIGVSERFGRAPIVSYNMDKCIEILQRDGMDYEEAVGFFGFNTLGAWVGEGTPEFITLYREPGGDIDERR